MSQAWTKLFTLTCKYIPSVNRRETPNKNNAGRLESLLCATHVGKESDRLSLVNLWRLSGAVNHTRAAAPVDAWTLACSQQGAPSLQREPIPCSGCFVMWKHSYVEPKSNSALMYFLVSVISISGVRKSNSHHNNNPWHSLSAYHGPDTVLRTLHVLTHVILTVLVK